MADKQRAKTASPIRVTKPTVSSETNPKSWVTNTRGSSVKGSDSSPLSGTLLAGLVEDLVDDGLAVIVVELQDVGGDFDQEGVEDALVPLQEDVSNLGVGELKAPLEDVIGLRDQLHVAILDTYRYMRIHTLGH
jgi:hypothetical protein